MKMEHNKELKVIEKLLYKLRHNPELGEFCEDFDTIELSARALSGQIKDLKTKIKKRLKDLNSEL